MKKIFILLVLILTAFFETGCWDMKELNEIGIVEATAIDFSIDTNKYIVTVQIANAEGSSTSGEKNGSGGTTWVGSAEGYTIFEALRNLSRISSKRIIWSHNTAIILGEEFVRNDITPAIDFFTHNPELRMKTIVFVSKGKAKQYLVSKAGLEKLTGLSLLNINRLSGLSAVSAKSDMLTLNSQFSSDYSQILIGAVDLKKSIVTGKETGSENKGSTVAIEGAAVFKKNKMIGWLSPEETRGVSWILNSTKDTIVSLYDINTENNYNKVERNVSVETKNVKVKIISKIEYGIPNITVRLTGEGNIVEQDGTSKLSSAEFQKNIQSLLNKKIVAEITKGVDKVQKDYKSDVLGLAQIVKVQNNKEWQDGLKDRWQEIFSSIPVKIDANLVVNSNTLKREPIKETKGK